MDSFFNRLSFFSGKPDSCSNENVTGTQENVLTKERNQTKMFQLRMETLKNDFFETKGVHSTLAKYVTVPRDIFVVPPPLNSKLRMARYHSQNTIFGNLYQIYQKDRCNMRKDASPWLNHCLPLTSHNKALFNQVKPICLSSSFLLRFMTPYLVLNMRYPQATSSEFRTLFGSIMKTTKLYPTAFCKGFLPSLMRSSPNAMLTLMLYEQMRSHLINRANASDRQQCN